MDQINEKFQQFLSGKKLRFKETGNRSFVDLSREVTNN
ncbi:hypothetical protein HMPREF1044_0574 [Streptococcus constellatus subsp. constellatus SK53]|uniref:Uncharacterized protein n=1 Tax=Streptococcus constellatus subsp. constellatus SK53 TaxID=1095730 RepID=A0AAD2SUD5_STRCV|nr:hypothetical protein HMPREF1044_0574 [Streptococcus constellatus subsp. constellatus SK53]